MSRDAGTDSRMKSDQSKPSSDNAASEGPGGPAFDFMSPEQRSTLEQLSVNLAKAAMTLQSAFSAAAMRQV